MKDQIKKKTPDAQSHNVDLRKHFFQTDDKKKRVRTVKVTQTDRFILKAAPEITPQLKKTPKQDASESLAFENITIAAKTVSPPRRLLTKPEL